jgi:hypothetical protein
MSQLEPRFLCRHIRPTGLRCGSPALRNEHFCYFHHTTRRPPAKPVTDPELLYAGPTHATFELPSLEDRPSIQLAIQEVARRIAANQLDPRRAALLLYALRIASANLPKEKPADKTTQPAPEPLIETYENHPTHGPLAPISQIPTPEQSESRIFTKWLESLPLRHTKTPDEIRDEATIPNIHAVADSRNQQRTTSPSSAMPADAILTFGSNVAPAAQPRVSGSMRRWRNWQTH